jgi:hypothetical protein
MLFEQHQKQQNIMEQLIRWGEGEPLLRAAILTSSRAIPQAHTDAFSDYDVILILTNIQTFFADRSWLDAFGSVLALYRDPLILDRGFQRSAYVTQYEDGLKIDFNLWPVELLKHIVVEPQPPKEFDVRMRIQIDHDWSLKLGPYGRGLKQWLPQDLWADLENTYTGAVLETNWTALFQTINLMRRVATEVGEALGFRYPDELEQRVRRYLHRVKDLDRNSAMLD